MVDTPKDVKEDGDISSNENESDCEGMFPQEKLQALAEFFKQPPTVKRRVKALKKLLSKSIDIEIGFYREIFEIEKKYESRYIELWNERKDITLGNVEPTDEQCNWPFDDDLQDINLAASLSKQAMINNSEPTEPEENADVKGIPKFWLKVLLHNSLTEQMITDVDKPILEHLEDIQCKLTTGDESGFFLEFHFAINEYFTNKVLTKQYIFSHSPPIDSPLDYDGPEIVCCKGCVINWKPTKNVTIKIVRSVKKHKNRKDVKTVTKTVKKDSFFNFFTPPSEMLNDPTVDEDTIDLLHEDFKIGHFIRESLVPRAVLYYTGEALDTDIDEDDEEDELETDEDEDDFEESEDDIPKYKRNPRPKKKSNGGGDFDKGASGGEANPECNQS